VNLGGVLQGGEGGVLIEVVHEFAPLTSPLRRSTSCPFGPLKRPAAEGGQNARLGEGGHCLRAAEGGQNARLGEKSGEEEQAAKPVRLSR
jgi:hypothetical protein